MDLFESGWEVCSEFCQFQLEILSIRRMVAPNSIGTNEQCFQNHQHKEAGNQGRAGKGLLGPERRQN